MTGDLSGYMTPAEFAGLGSDAHHAVWTAHKDGRVDAVQLAVGGSYRYHREQVLALLRETAEAR